MRRSGYTLAEVLVASVLSVLLLGLMLQIGRICWRGWNTVQMRQGAQQNALAVVARLRRDFHGAMPSSVSVSPESDGWRLSFLSRSDGRQQVGWDSTGQLLWRSWIQYRFSSTDHTVFRRQTSLTSATARPPLQPPSWPANEPGSLLSSEIRESQVTAAQGKLDATFLVGSSDFAITTRLRMLCQLYGED